MNSTNTALSFATQNYADRVLHDGNTSGLKLINVGAPTGILRTILKGDSKNIVSYNINSLCNFNVFCKLMGRVDSLSLRNVVL